jgi:hypothetical protein
VWMVGMHGIRQYLETMAAMSVFLKSEADLIRYAARPVVMLNLRGLMTGMFGRVLPHMWVQGLVAVSSIAVLAVAGCTIPAFRKNGETLRLRSGRARSSPQKFSLAVLAAALMSYHFNEHDASILIIPVVVALASLSTWSGAAAVAVVVGTLAGLSPEWGFLGAVPVIILFATEIRNPHFSQQQRELGHPSG